MTSLKGLVLRFITCALLLVSALADTSSLRVQQFLYRTMMDEINTPDDMQHFLDATSNSSDTSNFLLDASLNDSPALARARRLQEGQRMHIQSFDALAAAPWLLPSTLSLAYSGLHNDLPALLGVQGHYNRVSVVLYTHPVRDLLLNWVFSLVTYGGVRGYIVAIIDEESLLSCINLKLPCWDARPLLNFEFDAGEEVQITHSLGSKFQTLMHLKAGLAVEVLRLGYHVHFSDVDIVFKRNVWDSFNIVFEQTQADASFMSEQFFSKSSNVTNWVNCGHYVMLHNDRTLSLLQNWAAETPAKKMFYGEQTYFNSHHIRTTFWDVCKTTEQCVELKARGMTAIYPYPEQMNAMRSGHCPFVPWGQGATGQACSPWMLAIHYICRKGKERKIEQMKEHQLWFVGDTLDSTPTLWTSRQPHSYLPCQDTVADLMYRPAKLEPAGIKSSEAAGF